MEIWNWTWVAKSSRMPSLLIPCSRQSCFQNSMPIWFPHWPTWRVMISLGIFAVVARVWWRGRLCFSKTRMTLKSIQNYAFFGSNLPFPLSFCFLNTHFTHSLYSPFISLHTFLFYFISIFEGVFLGLLLLFILFYKYLRFHLVKFIRWKYNIFISN